MDGDDGSRPTRGVVVALKRLADGRLRLTLDRVQHSPDGRWEAGDPVTFKDFEFQNLVGMQLADEEFETLGTFVLAELVGEYGCR
jgi:hypothetical protein